MPVTTEANSSEVALNLGSFSLDSTLGQLQQNIDPTLMAKVRETLKQRLTTLRPWNEFGNSANFSKPKALAEASGRVSRNIRYFATNYLLIFISLFLYCLITSPLLLLAVGFAAAGSVAIMHFKEKGTPVVVGGKTLGPKEQAACLVGICVPLFWLASAGSVVFWLLGLSASLILCHATFLDSQMIPDAEAWETSVRETA